MPLEARRKGELVQDAFAPLVQVHGKPRIVADVIEDATPSSAERRLLMAGLLEAGSKGYVLKEESPTDLLFAIRTVAVGRFWLSSRLEVLALLGQGLSNPQIADTLCISVGTVRTHLNRIYDKTGLGGRSQAMRYAIAHGLVSASPEV